MSTETVPRESLLETIERETVEVRTFGQVVLKFLQGLASLKLTVSLFALAIILILAGTLAQHRKDIWEVVDQYFRVGLLGPPFGFAWFEFQDFLPPSFFPGKPQIPGGFYFPGGTLIGLLMAVNLLAAHGLRFKPQATGSRLWGGLGVIGVGVAVTVLVILSGSNREGVHESIWGDWSLLWMLMKAGLGVAFLASLAGYAWLIARTRSELWLLGVGGLVPAALGALFFYTIIGGEAARLDGPSMRILWQLMKATAAGLVLLAGCAIVFKKRAGIVLLHGGIGLMMFSEVQVAMTAVESQMVIDEGEAVNFTQDIRDVELAIVKTGADAVYNTVVPGRKLRSAVAADSVVKHEELPFDLKVTSYLPNSNLRDVVAGEANPATAGAGLVSAVDRVKPGTGTDSNSAVDIASAYVQLFDKTSGKPLGTWLFSQYLNAQPVKVGGETYDVELRFKRFYKPYVVKLIDVQKQDYVGTDTPRDYSSYVQLYDPTRNVDRKIRIWMNNPLRFAGETFYQSGYNKRIDMQTDPATGQRRPVLVNDPETGQRTPKFVETTTLSVVTNQGWMIPYVSCMIVATGLLAHFLFVLIRFLNRQQKERTLAEPAFDANNVLLPTRPVPPAATAHAGAARKIAKSQKLKARKVQRRPNSTGTLLGDEPGLLAWALPLAIVCVCALYVAGKARIPGPAADGMELYEAGKIPLVYQGRQKPLDTLARNSLKIISDRETFKGRMTDAELRENWAAVTGSVQRRWPNLNAADLDSVRHDVDELLALLRKQTGDDREQIELFIDKQVNVRQPAIRWLLDVIARPDRAETHKVFRIENLEVLDTLGLPRRDGFRYAVGEFREKLEELDKQVDLAQKVRSAAPEDMSVYQRKILDLNTRVRTYRLLEESFRLPPLPPLPTEKAFASDPQANMQAFTAFRDAYIEARKRQEFLERFSPPLLVPVEQELKQDDEIAVDWGRQRKDWETYATSWLNDFSRQKIFQQAPNSATLALQDIFIAYATEDADEFNSAVERYQRLLAASSNLPLSDVSKNRFEAFFNHFAPFFWSIWLYLLAFLIGCVAWIFASTGAFGWNRALNSAASWLIVLTLLLHTFALIARIYISGRPPVTNLYSSAIFIGWGAVVLGLIVEMIFKMGIGNIISSVAGFATLWIAHLLAGDGDTFTVLQAVLDTQFWLATHVTTITLGYATTFFAGLLGVLYVVLGFATPSMTQKVGRDLARMIYGTLCFAILFSFVGTVLGGLWADDSWGRFWGWDPKENGALIIVLWNALVLHARWGGMVKERGLAVLAIGGNIVTSWSWFGVNELGVGLHSYGFTEGVLLTLGIFVLSQLAVIAVGCLPKDLWWSFRERGSSA